MRMAPAAILAMVLWPTSTRAAGPGLGMLELTLDGQKVEGMPLAWDSQWVHLLGRDGRLWQFDLDEAVDFRKTSGRFQGYSVSSLRASLLRDLGKGFEVTGTTHYLVAHRRGQRNQWAQRFEDLYRSFVHYFSVRGFKISKPPFPLIGIVCRDQREFQRYAAKQGVAAGSGVLGVYSPTSNRIILYDFGNAEDSPYWRQNAAVIIHEATHQAAFNTGVHSRYTPPPLWVAEGLATMFEAPGVSDARRHTRPGDRINRYRLRDFRRLVAPRLRPELLKALVASDESFRSSSFAYAEAWALSYYLVETQPRKYSGYLARTAARPPFSEYTAAERTADFTAVFGDDWRMLQARLTRFMAEVE